MDHILLFVRFHLQLIRPLQFDFLLDVEFRVPIDEPLFCIRDRSLLCGCEVIVDGKRVNHYRCVHVSNLILAAFVLPINNDLS